MILRVGLVTRTEKESMSYYLIDFDFPSCMQSDDLFFSVAYNGMCRRSIQFPCELVRMFQYNNIHYV